MTDDDSADARHVGRFAPTPSGPLHAGSLTTALASWLIARRAGGRWYLRIDDLDRARCKPAHRDTLMRQLEAHGLEWDGAPYLQSAQIDRYRETRDTLLRQARLYRCRCTRARLSATQRPGPDGPVYDGRCRRDHAGDGRALRYACASGSVTLSDPTLGTLQRDRTIDIGDFVVWRADDVPGYHLACAVDEAALGITDVVRGVDLLGAAFCHIELAAALHVPVPRYRHLPLRLDAGGRKLSKQNHAAPLDDRSIVANLVDALAFLGQQPPGGLARSTAPTVLAWALEHWRDGTLPTPHAAPD